MVNSPESLAKVKSASATIRTIGIVGGGKVGLHLLELFSQSDLASVAFVVDREPTAPALEKARKEGISVFIDIDQALSSLKTDFIFEVTGSQRVLEILKEKLAGSDIELVTHEMAFIILQVIEQRDQASKNAVVTEIMGIRSEIKESLSGIQKLVMKIKEIAGEMAMLALNARIEAARAGEHGRGFGIVAQKMGEAVELVRNITPEIEKVSGNILSVSDRIEVSVNNLR